MMEKAKELGGEAYEKAKEAAEKAKAAAKGALEKKPTTRRSSSDRALPDHFADRLRVHLVHGKSW